MAAFNFLLGVLAVISQNIPPTAAAPAAGSFFTRATMAVPPFVLSYGNISLLREVAKR